MNYVGPTVNFQDLREGSFIVTCLQVIGGTIVANNCIVKMGLVRPDMFAEVGGTHWTPLESFVS